MSNDTSGGNCTKVFDDNGLVDRIFYLFPDATDADIAEIIRADRSTVQGWRRKKSLPTKAQIDRVVEYSDVDHSWIMTGKSALLDSVINAHFPYWCLNPDVIESVRNSVKRHLIDKIDFDEQVFMDFWVAMDVGKIPEGNGTNDSNALNGIIKNVKSSFYERLEGVRNDFIWQQLKTTCREIDTITDLNDIPIVGRAAADTSDMVKTELMQEIIGMIDAPETLKAIEIHGDSMSPILLDGQYALITTQENRPKQGSIVIAEVLERDGKQLNEPEYYCKRVAFADGIAIFQSQNTGATPVFTSSKYKLWPVQGVWFAGKGTPPQE